LTKHKYDLKQIYK